MAECAVGGASSHRFERGRCARIADWLAIAIAILLPWSTSATAVLIVLWLLALIPTLDFATLRRDLAIPAAAIPVALFAFGVLGMLWADATWSDRFGSIKAFVRLLAIPLLFIQFQRSNRGMWVLGGFLGSCTVLLIVSWMMAAWPSLVLPHRYPGVPVKDYIIQSGEFLICSFALAHLAISAWHERQVTRMLVLAVLALAFIANLVFVVTARSALVIFVALLLLLAVQRFDWKGVIVAILVGATLAGAAWVSSPYLRGRVLAVGQEINRYQIESAETSSGLRLEFWKKSLQFIAAAPVLGHGTGSVKEQFRKVATGESGPSSIITDQPHNQTLLVAIQLGFVGAGLLLATWIAHLLLFRGGGLVAWLGLGVVVQNFVSCLFNSYLFEFTSGWIYVFGVGVLGGMVLARQHVSRAELPSES